MESLFVATQEKGWFGHTLRRNQKHIMLRSRGKQLGAVDNVGNMTVGRASRTLSVSCCNVVWTSCVSHHSDRRYNRQPFCRLAVPQ